MNIQVLEGLEAVITRPLSIDDIKHYFAHNRILVAIVDATLQPKKKGYNPYRGMSRISRIQKQILNQREDADKLLNHNTKSENKKKIQEIIEQVREEFTAEELAEVYNQLEVTAEENKIDNRIFNGREAEKEICESLTDEEVWQLIGACYQECMGNKIHVSGKLGAFLEMFAVSFYKKLNSIFETYRGKIAHLHRVAESKLGKLVGCGVRALQKGIAWFNCFRGSCKENDSWRKAEDEKYAMYERLKERIESFLDSALPQLITASTN